jgi:hypothetical protein
LDGYLEKHGGANEGSTDKCRKRESAGGSIVFLFLLKANGADAVNSTSIQSHSWSGGGTNRAGIGSSVAFRIDVVDDKLDQLVELGRVERDWLIGNIPPDNLRTGRSRQTTIVVVIGRTFWNEHVGAEHIGFGKLALFPALTSLNCSSVAKIEVAIQKRLPSSQKVAKFRVFFFTVRLDHHSDDGISISSNFGVDSVQFSTKMVAIDGVLGTRVNVELECFVFTGDSWDFNLGSDTSVGVITLDTSVCELESDVLECTFSVLKNKNNR